MKINSLIKKSLHVEFYKDLISNIEDQNPSFNLNDFKGVMVIRDKNNNVYEISSHGNFSRNKNKQLNSSVLKQDRILKKDNFAMITIQILEDNSVSPELLESFLLNKLLKEYKHYPIFNNKI